MEASYEYQPLTEPGAIRLIRLHPSPNISSPLRCFLIPTTLDRCDSDFIEKYTALSYVWGVPDPNHEILVDDKKMRITASLDIALRHLRDPKRERLVWADAICINQRDLDEKSRQVAQMGRVYLVAQHTVIFLGKSTPQIEGVFRNKSASEEERMIALQDILSNSWFRRVWILQELVFSQDPWIQCGSIATRWTSFITSLQTLEKKHVFLNNTSSLEMNQLRVNYFINRIQGKDLDAAQPHGNSYVAECLLEVLKSRRGFGVTDSRDMIFAHLSLVPTPLPVHGSSTWGNGTTLDVFNVNYGHSINRVFMDCARFLIENLDDYQMFAHIGDEMLQLPGLPSWAPNWKAPLLDEVSVPLKDMWGDYFDTFRGRPISKVGLDAADCHLWLRDIGILSTFGWCLGRLSDLGSVIEIEPPSHNPVNHFKGKQPSSKDLKRRLRALKSSGLNSVKSFIEETLEDWEHYLPDTIRAQFDQELSSKDSLPTRERFTKRDADLERKSAPGRFVDECSLDEAFRELDQLNKACSIINYQFEKWGFGSTSIITMMIRRCYQKGPSIFLGRKFAVLESRNPGNDATSNILTLVPANTQPQDVVCILPKCCFPVVLRPVVGDTLPDVEAEIRRQVELRRNDPGFSAAAKWTSSRAIEHYKVVGECFPDGIINGGRGKRDWFNRYYFDEIGEGSEATIFTIH